MFLFLLVSQVESLLLAGSDPTIVSESGKNVLLAYLQLSVNERDIRILNALLVALKSRAQKPKRDPNSSKKPSNQLEIPLLNSTRDKYENYTPIMPAAAYGDLPAVKLLYEFGADASESWPMTPIMAAVAHMDHVVERGTTLANLCRTIRYLKETCKVDLHLNTSGKSALSLCFEFLNLKEELIVLETLVSLGVDASTTDETNNTYLMRAIRTINDGDLLLNTVRILCKLEEEDAATQSRVADMVNYTDYDTGDNAIMLLLAKEFTTEALEPMENSEDGEGGSEVSTAINNKYRFAILSHLLQFKNIDLGTQRPLCEYDDDPIIPEHQAGRTVSANHVYIYIYI